jgi:hypothetical protein
MIKLPKPVGDSLQKGGELPTTGFIKIMITLSKSVGYSFQKGGELPTTGFIKIMITLSKSVGYSFQKGGELPTADVHDLVKGYRWCGSPLCVGMSTLSWVFTILLATWIARATFQVALY